MKILLAKIAVAALALSVLMLGAMGQIAPNVSWWRTLSIGWGCIALLVAGFFILIFVRTNINALFLRAGSTDTQWFWFNDDPESFKKLYRSNDLKTRK